ncbi:Hydrogenase maturation protease [Acidisarcina polymorpha]|uniref:Hydrogenase maturation protease n=1 Tax=Acidisarcina polymorpha TaxID=2211140 RepID=A0A2Z5FUZ7_9BACT|nr:hydrogenase maturation protease [Acidisarcina polymorpha]AXC10337.1 Hydrogenase maturation protease [Acidisarcina polymorpha]
MKRSILVAGVGNVFLGDDAFGVETVRALAKRKLPEGVTVVDFGIRGLDFAYALLDPWDAVILVDALQRGGPAGTLYLLEPDLIDAKKSPQVGVEMNPHGMDPLRVLQLAFSMGEVTARIYIVGCEPYDFGDELEGRMGLSQIVESTIDGAAAMVDDLIVRITEAVEVCPA